MRKDRRKIIIKIASQRNKNVDNHIIEGGKLLKFTMTCILGMYEYIPNLNKPGTF